MNPRIANQPLNAAQNQLVASLASKLSKSQRMVLILGLLAVARLNSPAGAPKLLSGLSCKWIHSRFKGTRFECYYEAVRKLLKSLLDAGVVEICKGKYILADSVEASLRGLDSQHPNETTLVAGQPSNKAPLIGPESPENGAGQSVPTSILPDKPHSATARPDETTDDEINKKAVSYFVDLVASHCYVPSKNTYWQIACCRTSSLAELAGAASGLATAIMGGQQVYSPARELQAVLDGSSSIKPTSARSFVFAFEAFERECASEAKSKRDAELAAFFAPFKIQFLEMLMKRFAPQQESNANPDNASIVDAAPVVPVSEERPLGKVHQMYVYGDFGNAS